MMHIKCPQCERKLILKPELAGGVAVCPGCQTKLRIPESKKSDIIADYERDDQPENAGEETNSITAQPPRLRRPADDEDINEIDRQDDEAEAPKDRLRKRRRRRRKKRSRTFGFLDFLGFDTITLIALGIALVGFLIVPASFAIPPLIFIPMALGSVLSLVGWVWIVVIAFQDDSTQGLLCFCCGPYVLYYVIANFDEAKQPGTIWLVGTVLHFSASILASTALQR